ncbi:MAG TPA: inositol monophosphatase [Myxococcales bacterium]|nr:inositol monophosphatase [Myxococcales bacterium]
MNAQAHPPDAQEIQPRLELAVRIAQSAGAIQLQHFGRLEQVDEKSPIDLVTIADRDSEAHIVQNIEAHMPQDLVLAEERDGHDGMDASRCHAARWCWIIDPLDGTTNFSHSHPQFAVSIALVHYGAPYLGVIFAPVRKELFVGGVGVPPTLNGAPIGVSKTTVLSKSLLASGFPYNRREKADALLARVKRAMMQAHGFRRGGSAAMDLAELAAGRTDGFWEEGLAPWDLAAGIAILEAAGGVVTDLSAKRHNLFAGSTLASNGHIHRALFEQVVGDIEPNRFNDRSP